MQYTSQVCVCAAAALRNLSREPRFRGDLAAAGAIPSLAAILERAAAEVDKAEERFQRPLKARCAL